jgi:hypothetical protein
MATRPRKIVIVTFCSLAFVYALWSFGPQTYLALHFRKVARAAPLLNSIPVALQNQEVSHAPGETLSFRGAQFEAPWSDLIDSKSRTVGDLSFAVFESGLNMSFSVGAADMLVQALSHDNATSSAPVAVSALAGQDALTSDYAFEKAIFEATPSQITPFMDDRRARVLGVVLIMKAIMPPTSDDAIFNIQSDRFHGFQLGDPVHQPKKLALELFSSDMHVEITFFQEQRNGAPFITQAELNRIVQTLIEIPTKDATLTAKPL